MVPVTIRFEFEVEVEVVVVPGYFSKDSVLTLLLVTSLVYLLQLRIRMPSTSSS